MLMQLVILDRTSDGFANTQRRLKAELRETATSMGEALMPTVNELIPVISDLAEKVLPKLVEMFEKWCHSCQRVYGSIWIRYSCWTTKRLSSF